MPKIPHAKVVDCDCRSGGLGEIYVQCIVLGGCHAGGCLPDGAVVGSGQTGVERLPLLQFWSGIGAVIL